MSIERSASGDVRVAVALGSNLGDSTVILRKAMQRLEACSAMPLLRSSFWRTSPVDCPPGSPAFINAVVVLHPLAEETPETLLAKLKSLEVEFGRIPKTVLNEARPLDLDLIHWDGQSRDSAELTLPHPRAASRAFVLKPLAEIDPEMTFSGRTETVAQMLDNLRGDEVLERIEAGFESLRISELHDSEPL